MDLIYLIPAWGWGMLASWAMMCGAACVICAGGGAWGPNDEEPLP